MLMPSASMTSGTEAWPVCCMKASAVRLSVPMAGPRAMALNASERLGVVKIASSASWLSKASGTEICSRSLLRFGV